MTQFPRRIYTVQEFAAARDALAEGHKHLLKVRGSDEFKVKVKEILALIKLAGYYDFLRTYIRQLSEIDGVSQLREAEATIWLNRFVVSNPFEGARFIIQKTEQMKAYLDGKLYYFGGEMAAVNRSIAFLGELKEKIKSEDLRSRCDEVLKQWKEAKIV